MVCKDMGNAAQMAWVPLCHIVEEVLRGFREGGLEGFLLPTNGEPLGPPVCGIFPEALPFALGIASLFGYEMGAEDARGVRRAMPQSDLGELVGSFVSEEDFLHRQRTEDDSFSPDALALPLPPPSAADFPPLTPCIPNPGPPPKVPAPKLTKAEKATQGKINALLAPPAPAVKPAVKRHKAPSSTAVKTPEPPIRNILERPMGKVPQEPLPTSPPPVLSLATSPVLDVAPSASPDRAPSPVTPILAVAALQVAHSNACHHDPNTCAICRVGITCCTCQVMYTAPGTKRMRCSACLHWACDLDDNDACCSCGFLWVPRAHPLASCDHGHGNRIDQGKSDVTSPSPPPLPALNTESDSSLVSMPWPAARLYGGAPSIGSTTEDDDEDDSSVSAAGDDTVRPVIPPTPPPFPMSSADEIDAFTHIRYDDLTWSSTPEPAEAIPGYKHADWPDAILQCDDEDAYHFIKRGDADISKIADELDALMSGNTSLLDFLLPPSPLTFDVPSPPAPCDPLLSLRRQSASIV
ncbi:hypothetical protein AX14_013473 [Amanita brunnescens Koide BX004]|nr:hypothetical protein AX14_013473 [Amanita brunnescens Koide BX004]